MKVSAKGAGRVSLPTGEGRVWGASPRKLLALIVGVRLLVSGVHIGTEANSSYLFYTVTIDYLTFDKSVTEN